MIRHLKLTALGFADLLVESFYSATEQDTPQAERRSGKQLAKSRQLLFAVVLLVAAILALPPLLFPYLPALARGLGSSLAPSALALAVASVTFTFILWHGARLGLWVQGRAMACYRRGLELEQGVRIPAWRARS